MAGVGLIQRVAADVPRRRSAALARRWLGILALAALYRGAAEVGYALQFAGPVAAIMWLPVGVGMAFLYLGGLRYWPGVLLGDLLANDYMTLPLGSAVGQTIGNVLEVVVATLLLRRLVPRGDPLATVAGVARMVVAVAAGVAVSATIGGISLLSGGVVGRSELPAVWRTWWFGDFSGALLVLPLAVAWSAGLRGWTRRCSFELALVLAAVVALCELSFRSTLPLAYIVFPALMCAALRLGRRGATVAVAVAAAFALWETTRNVGPFAVGSITETLLATQLYLAVSALSTLCVAAVVTERREFARRLAASRARIVEAGARERRRIERDLHDGVQQRLIALSIRLELAAEQAHENPGSAVGRLQAAGGEVTAALEQLRELTHGIHPSVLTDHGLAGALRRLAAESPITLRLLELPPGRVDTTAEVTAYFVVLEAVANAHKHAGPSAIDIRAHVVDGRLGLVVSDDGRGGARRARRAPGCRACAIASRRSAARSRSPVCAAGARGSRRCCPRRTHPSGGGAPRARAARAS